MKSECVTEPGWNVRHLSFKRDITVVCFSSWKGLELLAAQSKTQDASCLPALQVSDIEPTIPITPVQISTAGAVQCLLYFSSYHICTVIVASSTSRVFGETLLISTGGVPVQYCEQPTNGLVYFRAMCSLNTLSEDLRLYVPLFCSVITKWVNKPASQYAQCTDEV